MVIDSSVWIEMFSNGKRSKECEKFFKQAPIYVPSLVLFEIYKKIKMKVTEDAALECVSHASQYNVLDLTREVALHAADLAIEHKLAMADSVMLAHARILSCPLLTMDHDFKTISGVVLVG